MSSNLFDLNSDDSDSEGDCDYVPPAGEISEVSEDNESINGDSEGESQCNKKNKRRKKKNKIENEEKPSDKETKLEMTPEEEKKKVDDLWKQFQMDVAPIRKRPVSTPVAANSNESKPLNKTEVSTNSPVKNSKVTITEIFDFAGEEVKVTKEVAKVSASNKITTPSSLSKDANNKSTTVSNTVPKRPVSGLAAALGAIAKKPKLSTLQKSLFDWSSFKRAEGIEEDLEQHNRGKDGYLEKQAFLQRSDLKQFEIEKKLRNISRRTPL